MMPRTITLIWQFFLITVVLTAGCSPATDTDNRPNILLIVVDDMGFSDIGPFEGLVQNKTVTAPVC